MLIIAMPKSASTSLACTLRQLHNLCGHQEYRKDDPVPAGYEVMAELHADVRVWKLRHLWKLTQGRSLFKQHIPPTQIHRRLLRGVPKVLLMRTPDQVPPAYYRATILGYTTPPESFKGCNSEAAWMKRAHKNGLLNELRCFRDNWHNEAATHPSKCSIVNYDEMLKCPKEAINRIERFLGLPETRVDITLLRKRFAKDLKNV